METFDMKYGGHKWEKQNLMTLGKTRAYDIYKCSCCGVQGKSYRLGTITVRQTDIKKMEKCKVKRLKPTYIKIICCRAVGRQFSNLTPGSIHEIIAPPEGETNKRGEWVMGVDEPVLVLSDEYEYVKE